MADLLLAARLDIAESLRARWFLIYVVVFGGLVALLFSFGLADSRVLGFTGLSRLLVIYIELSMAILPVFVLITTVRSLAGDREAGVLEYLLSLPVSLGSWYWGRFIGRFCVSFVPVFAAMLAAAAYGALRGADVPWRDVSLYTALLVSLVVCFLGLGFLISSLARSSEIAQGAAFLIWLALLLFLDLILLGVLIRSQAPVAAVVAIASLNPLQAFRTAAMLLFDDQLVMLGPAAYFILDTFGQSGYLLWAIFYPIAVGMIAGLAGFAIFKSRDLP